MLRKEQKGSGGLEVDTIDLDRMSPRIGNLSGGRRSFYASRDSLEDTGEHLDKPNTPHLIMMSNPISILPNVQRRPSTHMNL